MTRHFPSGVPSKPGLVRGGLARSGLLLAGEHHWHGVMRAARFSSMASSPLPGHRSFVPARRVVNRSVVALQALAAVMVASVCLLSAAMANATVNTHYGEVERFGGFDESSYDKGQGGGTLTPGKVINPRGFAVDSEDPSGGAQDTAVYVVERPTLGAAEHTTWMVQKLGEKGTVLGTATFTLPNGKFNDLAVEGLAVDHASKRLYALVVSGQLPVKAISGAKAPLVQELVAWSTEPNAKKELVAATGLTPDTLGTGAGVVATEEQLDNKGKEFLYQPQGIAVDQGVAGHPVAIEATDDSGGEDGTIVDGGSPGGNTLVRLVATSGSNMGELGTRWSSESVASQLGNTTWGPGGIATSPDGSLLVTLNDVADGALAYAVDLDGANLSATVLSKPESLPAPSDYDQRPYTGLGAPFGDAGVGQSVSEADGAGPEIVQLSTSSSSSEGGLYAALFAPGRSNDPQTGRQLLYFHTGLPANEKPEGGEKVFQGNLGVRLLQTGAGGQIVGPNGETIVNTLGDEKSEEACGFESFQSLTFVGGAKGALWVLEQGPPAEFIDGFSLDEVAAGGQIVELAPLGEGAGEHATACPQPEGTFTMQTASGTGHSIGAGEIEVPAGTTVKFDASGLNAQGGVPFAYEWQLDSEEPLKGKPINTMVAPEYLAPPATAEYTYAKPGVYKVKLTLHSDYGSYTTKEDTVKVTEGFAPTAHFAVTTSTPEQETPVAFDASGSEAGSGTVASYKWNWGDGTVQESEKAKLTHTYTTANVYHVSLIVVNSLGLESTVYEQSVTVTAKEPVKEPTKEPVKEPVKEPTKEPVKGPDRSPTDVSPHASSSAGSVKVQISCPATKTSCGGTLTVETANAVATGKKSKRKKRLALGQVSFSLAGGQSEVLTVHLSSAGAALLRTLKRLPVVVLATAHDSYGDPGTQSVRLTLTSAAAKKSAHRKKKH
jgi:PKD repeat protein